jgi:hypothetical protein
MAGDIGFRFGNGEEDLRRAPSSVSLLEPYCTTLRSGIFSSRF